MPGHIEGRAPQHPAAVGKVIEQDLAKQVDVTLWPPAHPARSTPWCNGSRSGIGRPAAVEKIIVIHGLDDAAGVAAAGEVNTLQVGQW